jgi:dUTP pyrophosphatase
VQVPLRRLDPGLPMPKRAHDGDAGVDLCSAVAVRLDPAGRALVPTGIAVAIPDGCVGLIAPRSGLAARLGLGVVNAPGVVDAGYRGEVKVILVNHGTEAISLERGERIAQLLVVPVAGIEFVEVEALPESPRGESGFGSTGT